MPSELTLRRLAATEDAPTDMVVLLSTLRAETAEGRHLEWKLGIPIGKAASRREKYRFARAAISFANTSGGFIVVGVDPSGQWLGHPEDAMKELDPAHFGELFAECSTPDFMFTIKKVVVDARSFLVVHIPPSPLAPHVTTSDKRDKHPSGKPESLLSRYTVYCRRGARSDLATPSDYERMIRARVEYVRDELVRRVKEVTVSIPLPTLSRDVMGGARGADLPLVRETALPEAPVFRRAEPGEEAQAVLVRDGFSTEALHDPNNLVSISLELATEKGEFRLKLPEYYKIYAARTQVEKSAEVAEHLALAGYMVYAPSLYWLQILSDERVAGVMRHMAGDVRDHSKQVRLNHLLRLAALLGEEAEAWLGQLFDQVWGRHSQKPDHVHAFLGRKRGQDPRLRHLSVGPKSFVVASNGGDGVTVEELLANPVQAAALLSEVCGREAVAPSTHGRGVCRSLDVLAYGPSFWSRGQSIMRHLMT